MSLTKKCHDVTVFTDKIKKIIKHVVLLYISYFKHTNITFSLINHFNNILSKNA